ncbi:MAG: Stp1/IreP family PP2C-type Ser/Thr phosphatase [Gloeobacterales cyanobacterium]
MTELTSPLFSLSWAGTTDVGRVRGINQDAYYANDRGLFILADGMGGHTAGEVASSLAIKSVRTFLESKHCSSLEVEKSLLQAARIANQDILEDAAQHEERGDMGTTLVIAWVVDSYLWYTHVGDSRLYRWDGSSKVLSRLTEDHTVVGELVAKGYVLPEAAEKHPYRNVLSRCLGRPNLELGLVQKIPLHAQDRYLLCSDGLTKEVPEQEIAQILSTYPEDQEAVEALVHQANAYGGRDNITVVLFSIL